MIDESSPAFWERSPPIDFNDSKAQGIGYTNLIVHRLQGIGGGEFLSVLDGYVGCLRVSTWTYIRVFQALTQQPLVS